MEILLALIYVSFCYVVFKSFRIPVNQWSLSTAVLGGIFGIFFLSPVRKSMHPKQDSHIRPLDEFKNLEGALPEDGLHKSGVLVGVSTPVGAVPNRNPPLEDRPLDAFFTYATQPSDVNDALVLVIPTGVVGKEALMQKYAEFMPSYFGKNWDALNECLHDLSWFEKKNIVIAHEEIPTMSQTDTKVYLRILAEAVQLLRAGPRTILYCHMARIVSMSAFENQCDP